MLKENENIFNIVLIAAILLGLIVVYFIWSLIRQQKAIVQWQQARIAAEIETLENERKRIAADLHDEIGPMLSAVKLQINHLEPKEESEQAALEKSSSQIDFIIQRFRDISYNLLPNTLIRKGLIKAVEEFVYRIQPKQGVQINLSAQQIQLTQEKEINVFRIIQEITHNTIKHARATKLNIEIHNKESYIELKTIDDGIGFEYHERMQHASGLGLLNLQSRVEVLQGTFTIDTEPGKGTTYFIQIPI